jgi:hypothetical protein
MNAAEIARRIEQDSNALRNLVASFATLELVGVCAIYEMRRMTENEGRHDLHSPARQLEFLLGLMLSTPEPRARRAMTERDWPSIAEALNATFNHYAQLFYPAKDGVDPSAAVTQAHDVTMRAYLHHHFGAVLASVSQIARRIERYVSPFDWAVADDLGLTASDALRVAQWIAEDQQSRADRVFETSRAAHALFADLAKTTKSHQDLLLSADRPDVVEAVTEFHSATAAMYRVERAALVHAFGKVGERYWERFSVSRGEGPPIQYPTERSIAHLRPLIRLTDTEAMIVSVNALFHAILTVTEDVLRSAACASNFLSHRDSTLENEASELFARLAGPNAVLYKEAFEQPDDQFEHDAIVIAGDVAFIVEAKASPPREPFRDPLRAFPRIRDAFRGPAGIQKGFEQAARIKRRLDAGKTVRLFSRGGAPLVTLDPDRLRATFSVVVTRDDFGALATDLTMLLEKEKTDAFPWVINIFDLEAIAEAWRHLKWSVPALRSFLEERIALHGLVHSTDELDFVGCYIRHGSFRSVLRRDMDLMQLDPSYSDFFDQLEAHLQYGAPPPAAFVGDGVAMDLRESIAKGVPVMLPPLREVRPGRNEPCPCGSGRKFKKCHGANSKGPL